MNVFAAYVAYSQGITTLPQLVCAEFRSIWGKRKMWSVCIVDVWVVQVGIECLYGIQNYEFSPCHSLVATVVAKLFMVLNVWQTYYGTWN